MISKTSAAGLANLGGLPVQISVLHIPTWPALARDAVPALLRLFDTQRESFLKEAATIQLAFDGLLGNAEEEELKRFGH